MNNLDMEKALRGEIRWRILRCLDAGRPSPLAESVILAALTDSEIPCSPGQLRREMAYLEKKGLLQLKNRETPVWAGELTHGGIDFVEYGVPDIAGIHRPKKWW